MSDSDDIDLDDSKPKSDLGASDSSSDEGDCETGADTSSSGGGGSDGTDSNSDSGLDSDLEITGSDENLDSESDSEDHIKKKSTVNGDWVLARSHDNKMTARHSKNKLPRPNEKLPKLKRRLVDLNIERKDNGAEVVSSLSVLTVIPDLVTLLQ